MIVYRLIAYIVSLSFQCDIFEIEAVTLEKLSKIQVGHDGKGIGAGWYLDKIVVKNPDNPKYNVTFECFWYVLGLKAYFYTLYLAWFDLLFI